VPTQPVDDVVTVIKQEQEDMRKAENAGLISRGPENNILEMMVAIRGNLIDFASSDTEEDGNEDDNEDTKLGKLGEDNKPGLVMGTISKTVQQRSERFRQIYIEHDQLTRLVWGNTANYFRERDSECGTTYWSIPAAIEPQTDDVVATPAPTAFEEQIEWLDIILRRVRIPQGMSQLGSSHMSKSCLKPQWHNGGACLLPDMEPEWSPVHNVMPVEPVCIYPWISPPQLLTK